MDQGRLENNQTKIMRDRILELLKDGLHLSELDGLRYGYGTSFRTRISELRKQGWDIKDYFDLSVNGARFKRYYLSGISDARAMQ